MTEEHDRETTAEDWPGYVDQLEEIIAGGLIGGLNPPRSSVRRAASRLLDTRFFDGGRELYGLPPRRPIEAGAAS